ncbi:MAG: YdiU family protein [Neisseriaceae bacterium]|nr:YdiU family protein [Neisseriaceae bacterium]
MELTQLLQQNRMQQLPKLFYAPVKTEKLTAPTLLLSNQPLANQFNLNETDFLTGDNLGVLSGNPKSYRQAPIATLYSGHQFGHYTAQLGDGRAVIIGDVVDKHNQRWEWQLKGAGQTPFSRHADGRAVLRSSIREYLCSEAMAALHIPTTRALSLVASDDPVYRERVETAAIVTRLAPSFIRFGHFEVFYHRKLHTDLQLLADHVIDLYYPQCREAKNPYLAFFEAVSKKTAETIALWQSVGFCHGVLNTDNMSILGLTLDYGPFGFLDGFDFQHVCNHSDHAGRYAFNQQPFIGQWNLSCLASTLLPFAEEAELVAILNDYARHYQNHYDQLMAAKLGLQTVPEAAFVLRLLRVMAAQSVDFTLFFRALAQFDPHTGTLPAPVRVLLTDPRALDEWLADYAQRLLQEGRGQSVKIAAMNGVNPKYILRNYLLEQAIKKAENKDYSELNQLAKVIAEPYAEWPEYEAYAALPPAWSKDISISCSS